MSVDPAAREATTSRALMHELRIRAPREQVWRVLSDFRRYSEWNPFLWNVVGEAKTGARVLIQMKPPGGNPMRFAARVERAEERHELRWTGRFLSDRLFRAEYGFRLEPARRDETRVIQTAQFSGSMAGLVPAALYRRQEQGLQAMTRALQARAEGREGPGAGSGTS